jgi:phosphoglycolate phosphatase-like HAD superfamily hydrolase
MKSPVKPVVFIDVDDTIADTVRHVLGRINEGRPQPYQFHELTLNFREGRHEGKEYNQAVKALLQPKLVSAIAPYPDALEALRRLHRAGYEIHIVSARQELLHEVTARWLERHGFADFIERIHPRPNSLKGKLFKQQLTQRIKPVALFDDTLDVALELAGSVDSVFLIDKPWNNGSDLSLPANVIRSADFARAVDSFLA